MLSLNKIFAINIETLYTYKNIFILKISFENNITHNYNTQSKIYLHIKKKVYLYEIYNIKVIYKIQYTNTSGKFYTLESILSKYMRKKKLVFSISIKGT